MHHYICKRVAGIEERRVGLGLKIPPKFYSQLQHGCGQEGEALQQNASLLPFHLLHAKEQPVIPTQCQGEVCTDRRWVRKDVTPVHPPPQAGAGMLPCLAAPHILMPKKDNSAHRVLYSLLLKIQTLHQGKTNAALRIKMLNNRMSFHNLTFKDI